MRDSVAPPTNPSLLGRLRQFPADEAAWAEFVHRSAAIYGWCRGRRPSPSGRAGGRGRDGRRPGAHYFM